MGSPLDSLYYMSCAYNPPTNVVTISANLVAEIQLLMDKSSNQIISVPLIYSQTKANIWMSQDFKLTS